MDHSLDHVLEKVQVYRENGDLEKVYKLLLDNKNIYQSNSRYNYELGVTCDNMGREAEAVGYYEASLELGLSGTDRMMCLICLGSSYRELGQLVKSTAVLEKAMDDYPDNLAVRCFYALTLYSLEDHKNTIKSLFDTILRTSHEDIRPFSRAIKYYADHL